MVKCPSDALFRISEVVCSPGTSRLLFYEFLTNNLDMLLSSHTFLSYYIEGKLAYSDAKFISNEFIAMHSGLFICLRKNVMLPSVSQKKV